MHESFTTICVPQLGVNDDCAVIRQWLMEDGAKVAAGDIICSLETAKAVYDVQAEQSGFLVLLASVDAEVKVSQPIALVGPVLDALKKIQMETFAPSMATTVAGKVPVAGPRTATKKAQALAVEKGISLDAIQVDGIISEKHVLAYLAGKTIAQHPVDLVWDQSRTPIMIYGAGNGGLTMREAILAGSDYHVACFVDDHPTKSALLDVPVLKSSMLSEIIKKGVRHFAVAIAVGSVRLRVFQDCVKAGFEPINVIHPKSFIAPSVELGLGNYVKSGAIVETNTRLGDSCLIDNGVVVAHDCILEDACHLAPGCKLGSSVTVGRFCIIGVGCSIATGAKIGHTSIISPGSSVVQDVPALSVIEGVPGRVVGQRKSVD